MGEQLRERRELIGRSGIKIPALEGLRYYTHDPSTRVHDFFTQLWRLNGLAASDSYGRFDPRSIAGRGAEIVLPADSSKPLTLMRGYYERGREVHEILLPPAADGTTWQRFLQLRTPQNPDHDDIYVTTAEGDIWEERFLTSEGVYEAEFGTEEQRAAIERAKAAWAQRIDEALTSTVALLSA